MKKCLISSMLVLLMGCGGASSSTRNNELVVIPSNTFITLPDSIANGVIFNENISTKVGGNIFEESDFNIGILNLRITVQDHKNNIILLNSVMSKIIEECSDIPVNITCEIPENFLSLTFTEALVGKLIEETDITFSSVDKKTLIGKSVNLGKVEFVQYDKEHPFDYELLIDANGLYTILHITNETENLSLHSKQLIKWTKDKKKIFLSNISEYSDGVLQQPTTLFYEYNLEKQEENMYVSNKFLETLYDYDESILYSIQKIEGVNSSFSLKLNSVAEYAFGDNIIYYKHDFNLKEQNNTGILSFDYQEFLDQEEHKKSSIRLYDTEGFILGEKSCTDKSIDCDLLEQSTWTIDGNFSMPNNLLNNDTHQELQFSNEGIEDGEYLLLPLEYDISNLLISNVMKAHIGRVIVFRSKGLALLYDLNYLNKLDKLQLVKYNSKLDRFDVSINDVFFELIKREDIPIFLAK